MGLGISPHETPNANALLANFTHSVTHTGSDSSSGTPPSLDLERSQLCRSPSTKHFFTVQPMVTPPLLSSSEWSMWYATAKDDSSKPPAPCPNLSGRTSGTIYTSDRTPNSFPTSEDLLRNTSKLWRTMLPAGWRPQRWRHQSPGSVPYRQHLGHRRRLLLHLGSRSRQLHRGV